MFDDFNQGELSSYLIEITHKILLKPDKDIVVWKDSTMLPKVVLRRIRATRMICSLS